MIATRLLTPTPRFLAPPLSQFKIFLASSGSLFHNITAVDDTRPVWPNCPAMAAPWATGVDHDTGLPNGEPLSRNPNYQGYASMAMSPNEHHTYDFAACLNDRSCRPCQDDAYYAAGGRAEAVTVFASEYGWLGMPSLESLEPYLSNASSRSSSGNSGSSRQEEETDYRILSPVMVQHSNRIVKQPLVVDQLKWMFGDRVEKYIEHNDRDSFRRVIHMSQVVQADCVRAETYVMGACCIWITAPPPHTLKISTPRHTI